MRVCAKRLCRFPSAQRTCACDDTKFTCVIWFTRMHVCMNTAISHILTHTNTLIASRAARVHIHGHIFMASHRRAHTYTRIHIHSHMYDGFMHTHTHTYTWTALHACPSGAAHRRPASASSTQSLSSSFSNMVTGLRVSLTSCACGSTHICHRYTFLFRVCEHDHHTHVCVCVCARFRTSR